MHSIRWRLTLTYLAITLLSTLGLGLFLVVTVRQAYLDERRDMLKAHAVAVRSEIAASPEATHSTEELACLVQRLSHSLGTHIIITTSTGQAIVDTAHGNLHNAQTDKPCAPVQTRCQDCHGTMPQPPPLSVTEPLSDDAESFMLTVSPPHSGAGLRRVMERIRSATIVALLVTLLVVSLISVRVASGIASPILGMNRMARRMAEGDLEQRVQVGTRDEVGELAASFNEMAERIRRSVNALAEEKNKLRTVLEQMADGIIVTNAAGRILVFNPACEEVFGVAAATVLDQQVYGATFMPDLQRAIQRALQGESVVEEMRLRYPQPMVLGVYASPFRDGEGHTQGAIVLIQDRTELRRIAELQRDFIANASHELRTPAAAIHATVETLLDGAKDDPAARDHFIAALARESERLTALTTNLLDLSRIEAASGSPQATRLDLPAVLADVLELARPALESRKLALETAVPADLQVSADRVQLTQILTNLVDNAVKYTPDGGTIRVEGRLEDGCVVVAVSDTGIGIAPADQERIFERFYRVDKARSRALGGTGLGLAIAREAAEAHGGSLTVAREPGKGSTFTLKLPAA